MRLALTLARRAADKGEVPIGCVVVHQGKTISRAANSVECRRDATRHAEMVAIRTAARKLKNWRLTGCAIYVTKEPCPMCAAALALARVDKIVFGVADPEMGACGSKLDLVTEGTLRARIDVVSGVLEHECRALLQDFFRLRRKSGRLK